MSRRIECLKRVRLFEDELAALARMAGPEGPLVALRLQLVRTFGEEAGGKLGEDDDGGILPDGSIRLKGQHRLLGWDLTPHDLQFLVAVNAALDADEYG